MMKNKKKAIRNAILWIIGIWAISLIILQIVLSPAVLTRVADRYTKEYINADVDFGKVSVSVLRNFPNLHIGFENVSVTYPSERFSDMEAGIRHIPGRGENADTLMSFKTFSASLNIAALAAGTIRVPSLTLVKPRVFARSYNDGSANWDILPTSSDVKEDTTSTTGLPDIVLGKIHFSEHPHIVYSNVADTTHIILDIKDMKFGGRLNTGNSKRNRIGLKVDSMFVAGRFPSDTMALKLNKFYIGESNKSIRAKAEATAFLATSSYGRVRIPVNLESKISFPEDSTFAVSLQDFRMNVASIPFKADADIRYVDSGNIYIKGKASVDKCKINDVLKYANKNILKEATGLKTDATVSMYASCDGYYSMTDGIFPMLTAEINIPKASVGHKAIGDKNEIALDALLKGDSNGMITFTLGNFYIKGKGISVSATGKMNDIMGGDPLIDIDADAAFQLDTLGSMMKQNSGMTMHGGISAGIKGSIRASQLNTIGFAQADVSGFIQSGCMSLSSVKDTLDMHLDSLDVWFGATGNTYDKSVEEGERMLAVVASVDSAHIIYKDLVKAAGKDLSLKAQNSASILDRKDSTSVCPFGGRLEIGFISLMGTDTTIIAIAKSDNIFKISPKSGDRKIPLITLKSKSGNVFIRGPINRVGIRDLDMDATAASNVMERKQKAKAFVDSLSKRYPDVPRDSLFSHLRKVHGTRQIPEWLTEKDFRKQDLQFNLDTTVKKYFRDWDISGSLSLSGANIVTPYFPLRNRLTGFSGKFTNNEIDIDHFSIESGKSSLSAEGRLSGLKGAVLGRGAIHLDMDIRSDSLNLNELLNAYSVGNTIVPKALAVSTDITEVTDEDYQDMIVTDTLANAQIASASLVVVPSNIRADIKLDASDIRYSTLHIDRMTSNLVIKERCVQFTNTAARSNIGDIDFEGFYSTRTKKDLKTGFDLNLKDITAEKVIEMIPAVDSIMPMLKSFKGNLNCEVAATADIDTSMNIVMPSLNGVIRIGGNNLTLQDSEAFRQIAKKLMFKDKHNGHINKMTVEGVIKDNTLEVFPFVLKMDRYTLAMSGVQNLDMTFRYHISVLDSPIPFRLGVDISGDFEDFKFKIGKAKYKSTNIPVFTTVIDQTRLNLKESIENIFVKGVDEAVRQNEKQNNIEEFKKQIDYTRAVDEQLDSLSDNEKLHIVGQEEVQVQQEGTYSE